nr:galactokinase [Spirochaetales bacterium]
MSPKPIFSASEHIQRIQNGILEPLLSELYGSEASAGEQSERFISLLERHIQLFGDSPDVRIFSTPGRTELGGNHTDHNHGRVIAGSIHLDTIAAAAPSGSNQVILDSVGFEPVRVDLNSLTKVLQEKGTTDALVRGIAMALNRREIPVTGFTANTSTRVLKGSGLSSSAAVEILIGSIFKNMAGDKTLSPIDLALCGKFAENNYFEKPSGLMDQTACAHGGIIGIDFIDPDNPKVEQLSFDFRKAGYTLCVVDTGGNHANLTPEYAAIPQEMGMVAAFFGKQVLREITIEQVVESAAKLRVAVGDRPIL